MDVYATKQHTHTHDLYTKHTYTYMLIYYNISTKQNAQKKQHILMHYIHLYIYLYMYLLFIYIKQNDAFTHVSTN